MTAIDVLCVENFGVEWRKKKEGLDSTKHLQ